MPPKPFKQKFRRNWLADSKLQPWIAAVKGEDCKAYCSYCGCTLGSKYSELLAHAKTKKHCRSMIENKPLRLDVVDFNTSHVKWDEDAEKILPIEHNQIFENDSDSPQDSGNETPQRIPPVRKRKKHKYNFNDSPTSSSSVPCDEFPEIDIFARSIAAQMKTLPEKHVIDLTCELQSLVARKRQLALEERNTEKHSNLLANSRVITVTMPTTDTQSIPSLMDSEL